LRIIRDGVVAFRARKGVTVEVEVSGAVNRDDDRGDEATFRYRVLLVEDEQFTRGLLTQTLTGAGIDVLACTTVTEAMGALAGFDPHVVMTDLDLGPGPSGVHLLRGVEQQAPWVGRIVLSVHASPQLGARDWGPLSGDVVYLVKPTVSSVDELLAAIEAAVEHKVVREAGEGSDDRAVISASHGEVLRLVAEGLSNAGIAEVRGTSVNAAEAMVQRMFLAMGIRSDRRHNARVLAVRMWQQGRVVVR
jgi:DNA-binding NarL/FixJ family response regulator